VKPPGPVPVVAAPRKRSGPTVTPPGDDVQVTEYPMMGWPPSSAGACQVTVTVVPLVGEVVATTSVGWPGVPEAGGGGLGWGTGLGWGMGTGDTEGSEGEGPGLGDGLGEGEGDGEGEGEGEGDGDGDAEGDGEMVGE